MGKPGTKLKLSAKALHQALAQSTQSTPTKLVLTGRIRGGVLTVKR